MQSPVVARCTRASTLLLSSAQGTHTLTPLHLALTAPGQPTQLTVPVGNQHQSTTMAGDDIASHYEVLEELGRGSFGVVYKGIERATGETVAIKHVSCTSRIMQSQPSQQTSLADPTSIAET